MMAVEEIAVIYKQFITDYNSELKMEDAY